MNLFLKTADKYIPLFIRKRELIKLFHLTASAFGSEAPSMDGRSYDEYLAAYAMFSKQAVDQSVAKGTNIQVVQDRLFQYAFQYGKLWRKRFGVSTISEAMKAGKILYRALGIEFHGTDRGDIEIKKCCFSQHYSPATCKVISSLDAGIMAGLSDGAVLSFSQRITEGFDSCKAQLGSKEIIV